MHLDQHRNKRLEDMTVYEVAGTTESPADGKAAWNYFGHMSTRWNNDVEVNAEVMGE